MQERQIAVAVVIIRHGKILLVKNRNGWWVLPGGKMEQDESDMDCLLREISEELPKAKLRNIVFYGKFLDLTPTHGSPFELRIYHANMEGTSKVGAEVSEAVWTLSPQDLCLPGATKKVIESLQKDNFL